MSESNRNDADRFETSRDAADKAGFQVDLARLSAALTAAAARGASPKEIIDDISLQRRTRLHSAFEKCRQATLSWWHYLRNPLWAFAYTLLCSRLLQQPPSWPAVRQMERAWSRAMYGRHLSMEAILRLQLAHQTGVVSKWQALTLIRAMCSRVTSEGHWRVQPIGRLGLWIGSAFLVPLLAAASLLVAEVFRQFELNCGPTCDAIGAALGVIFLGYWIALIASASWGRHLVRGAWVRVQSLGR